jgi:hypothetical protein
MIVSNSTGRLFDVFLLRVADDTAPGRSENVFENAATALPIAWLVE